jgi:hypothetical protein
MVYGIEYNLDSTVKPLNTRHKEFCELWNLPIDSASYKEFIIHQPLYNLNKQQKRILIKRMQIDIFDNQLTLI